MDWADFFSKLIVGAASGLVVAFFTARYALNRFYREKWWDRRADLYIELVDSLYKIKKAQNYWYEKELSKVSDYDQHWTPLTTEKEEELQSTFNEEIENLSRVCDLSPLLLNRQCGMLITSYFENKSNLYMQYYYDDIDDLDAFQKSFENTKKLFNRIILVAGKELKAEKPTLKRSTYTLLIMSKKWIKKIKFYLRKR